MTIRKTCEISQETCNGGNTDTAAHTDARLEKCRRSHIDQEVLHICLFRYLAMQEGKKKQKKKKQNSAYTIKFNYPT